MYLELVCSYLADVQAVLRVCHEHMSDCGKFVKHEYESEADGVQKHRG